MKINLCGVFVRNVIGAGLFSLVAAPAAKAVPVEWNGSASTAWGLGSNWVGGTPPADDLITDIATFNSVTFSRQPQVAGTRSVNGIVVGDGVTNTGALTISGTSTPFLNLGSSGITVSANAGTVAVSAPVRLGADQNWANHSGSLLTVSGTLSNAADLTPFTLTMNGSGAGGTTISGIISNGGSTGTTALNINTTGGGVTTLTSGSNNFTGGVTLTQGILRASQGGSTGTVLGGTATTVTLAGGELRLVRGGNSNATTFTAANTTITGNTQITSEVGTGTSGVTHTMGTLSMGGQTLTVAAGSMVASGTAGVTFGATNLTGAATFSVGSMTQLNLGALTGSSAMTKDGAGRLNLNSAAASFSGGVNINEGTVNIASATALGTGAGTINLGQTGGSADANLEFGTSFGTYAANLIVIQSGSGSRTITASGGTSGNSRKNITGAIVMNNDLTIVNTATHSGNSGVEFSGGITGTGNLVLNNSPAATAAPLFITTTEINHIGSIAHAGTGTTQLTAVVGSNVTSITHSGSGTFMLAGANTSFAGDVFVENGTFRIGNSNALNAANTLAVGATATVDLKQISSTSYDQTIAGLDDISGAGGTVTNSSGTVRTLTLAGSGSYEFGGDITATNTANMRVAKTGSGVQILSGANAYTGTTTISGGTLLVNGSIADSLVSVNSGGTFGGSGTVGGDTTAAAGSFLAPGTEGTAGELGFAADTNLDIAGLASGTGGLIFELGAIGSGSDLITLSGSGLLTIGTGVLNLDDFDFTTLGGFGAGVYTLFDTDTAISGSLDANVANLTGLIGSSGLTGTLSFGDSGNDLILTVAPIPEPSTYALLTGGLIALAFLRRKKSLEMRQGLLAHEPSQMDKKK